MRSAALVAALLLTACGGGSSPAPSPQPAPAPVPTPTPSPPPAPAGVVLVGDELVANWAATAPATYPAGAYNAGVAGATTAHLAASFQASVLSRRPAIVVLSGGLNDIYPSHKPLDDNAGLFRMAEQAATAGACVVLVDILPADVPEPLQTYNQGREVWAASYGYKYVQAYGPLAAGNKLKAEVDAGDGRHINAAGYAVLGPLVAAGIARCP